MNKKGRILSGIQPTGRLHLGNLLGAVNNWVKLQDEYESFFMIADLHALTTAYDSTQSFKEDIFQLAVDLLSAGLDSKKCCIFKQSDVPEHSELHLILSMITPLPWLERVPSYKGKINEMKEKDLGTYGFLGYPVLQAADILIYKADTVPVGQDQVPHLELTREIARRFNNFYGNVFPIPKEKLTKFPTLLGIDGRKMSKSYGNTIAMSDEPETVKKKVKDMITDPARVKKTDKGHPEICAVYAYHKIFNKPEVEIIEKQCRGAEIGCVDCKGKVAEKLIEYLSEILARRKEIEANPEIVHKTLGKGAISARLIASQTLQEVKKAMNLI